MLYLLLVVSTLMATGKSVVFKKIGIASKSSRQFLRFNALSFAVATIIALAVSGFSFKNILSISPYSAFMSLLFAFCVIFTYLTQIKALSYGNASSTMLIYSCGFLLPIFFGVFAYDEKVSVVQIIAIVFLLLSLILIVNPQKSEKPSFLWLLFSFLSMLGSGTTAILQKIHQRSQYADEFASLLVLEFLVASLVTFIILSFTPKKENYVPLSCREAGVISLNGLFLGLLNTLNLRLAGKLPAIILFPVYNIGSIVLCGILCSILYKEKNTKKEILGFIIGCISILFIGIF